MARTRGTYTLSANTEILASAPLDARERVQLKTDLTAAGTFPYPYEGMEVYVVEEKKKYRLIGDDPTVSGNWQEVGIQVETLPTASADELGNIYQYIGESGTYTHGCFYECVKLIVLGESTYEWKMLNVIKNPVVSAEQPFNVKDYEDETVIVYSGEDLYDFKQGHHYIVKNNIGMDLYYLAVTQKTGEEPLFAFIKNNPAQIGEHFYDVSGFCIGILTDITDVSASFYLFSSQTVKTYDNPQITDTTAHFSATDYFDIGGGGSSYQFSEDFVNEDNNVSLVPEQRIFTGTQAEWDALTTEEKLTYGQVNITDDESDPSVVVDAVTNGDMHAVTSNAVYDELKKVQSQTYECSGLLINSLAGEILGYGRATVTLKDGVAEIKFSARIHSNTMTSTFSWGLNRDLLRTLIPSLPQITPVNTNSNLLFFAANGTALIDLMGYGAMASGQNQFWIPARMYQTSGGTGVWGSDQFTVNSYITGTVYGTYTV